MNKIYKHSGTLGDLIYSLHLVKKQGDCYKYEIAIENIERCVAKYGYRPEDVDPQHKGRFTQRDYEMLLPLLRRQSYIETVGQWHYGDAEPDVDLDEYRRVLYRTFEGNILQAYHLAFDVPFTMKDYDEPWLEADAVCIKPIVVSRSARYRPANGEEVWRDMISTGMFEDNSVFVGTPAEHADFEKTFGITMPYHPVDNFLELANIIAGADLFVGNQGFAYSLAIGLGQNTVLEANKIVPLQMNECFFPRKNCQYF
jgi:hypothetical protein